MALVVGRNGLNADNVIQMNLIEGNPNDRLTNNLHHHARCRVFWALWRVFIFYRRWRMTEAETILKMIETVDPADSAKLDEIDIRTQLFIYSKTQQLNVGYRDERDFYLYKTYRLEFGDFKRYTRSRDLLKQIRPVGYTFRIFQDINLKWQSGLYKVALAYHGNMTLWFPTEELAELHAIIQAIDYERRSS